MGQAMIGNFIDLHFRTNEWGQLVMMLPTGDEQTAVEPVRCFPLSDPDHLISILDADGKELTLLPSLDVLNPKASESLRHALAEREFAPQIRRIVSTSVAHPPCEWTVETDRGTTRFHLESEDDIRRLSGKGAVIADSNGIRYMIPDISKLDSHSAQILRRVL